MRAHTHLQQPSAPDRMHPAYFHAHATPLDWASLLPPHMHRLSMPGLGGFADVFTEGEIGGGEDLSVFFRDELIDEGGAISDGSVSRSSMGSPCAFGRCVHRCLCV